MAKHPTSPRWAREGEVRPGTLLVADGGFPCITEGERLVVETRNDELFVPCKAGGHLLEGQLNEAGEYVGFSMGVGQ